MNVLLQWPQRNNPENFRYLKEKQMMVPCSATTHARRGGGEDGNDARKITLSTSGASTPRDHDKEIALPKMDCKA